MKTLRRFRDVRLDGCRMRLTDEEVAERVFACRGRSYRRDPRPFEWNVMALVVNARAALDADAADAFTHRVVVFIRDLYAGGVFPDFSLASWDLEVELRDGAKRPSDRRIS